MLNAAAYSEMPLTPTNAPDVKKHSKAENRDAIHFHYDVSNEFYALWLDRAMVYSCAYFETPDVDLDAAQDAKLEHICRKLSLKAGESFLDIGCGWGALVIHAAQRADGSARPWRNPEPATIESGAGANCAGTAGGQRERRAVGLP